MPVCAVNVVPNGRCCWEAEANEDTPPGIPANALGGIGWRNRSLGMGREACSESVIRVWTVEKKTGLLVGSIKIFSIRTFLRTSRNRQDKREQQHK